MIPSHIERFNIPHKPYLLEEHPQAGVEGLLALDEAAQVTHVVKRDVRLLVVSVKEVLPVFEQAQHVVQYHAGALTIWKLQRWEHQPTCTKCPERPACMQ